MSACTHLTHIHKVTPHTKGCEECLKMGDTWVHLRLCMECGHVGCCDSSKNKHATKTFIARSIPSCVPSNRANPGAGATSTKSNSTSPDLWSAAAQLPLFPSYSLRRGSTLLNPMSALSLDLVTLLPRSYAFLFNPEPLAHFRNRARIPTSS